MNVRALVDSLLTYLGCFFVAFVPINVVTTAALPPDATTGSIKLGATALVSVPLAVAYRRSGRSLGDLGAFYFWTVLLTLILGFAVLVGFVLLDATFKVGSPANAAFSLGFLGVIYAIAYYRVYRDGNGSFRSQVS